MGTSRFWQFHVKASSKMARTGGNLSELKPVKTCVDFIRHIPVLSTPPIFITEKQIRNINKQLYAKVF